MLSISVIFQAKGKEMFLGEWVVIDMEAVVDYGHTHESD